MDFFHDLNDAVHFQIAISGHTDYVPSFVRNYYRHTIDSSILLFIMQLQPSQAFVDAETRFVLTVDLYLKLCFLLEKSSSSQQLLMVLLCVHRCWFFWYYHFFVSLLPCLVLEHITSFGNTSYWHELGTFTLLRAIRYIGNKEDCKLDFREFPFPAPSQIGF